MKFKMIASCILTVNGELWLVDRETEAATVPLIVRLMLVLWCEVEEQSSVRAPNAEVCAVV